MQPISISWFMSAKGFVAVALLFKSLGKNNGHHQNYDIFSRKFRPKLAFATSASWVGGGYIQSILLPTKFYENIKNYQPSPCHRFFQVGVPKSNLNILLDRLSPPKSHGRILSSQMWIVDREQGIEFVRPSFFGGWFGEKKTWNRNRNFGTPKLPRHLPRGWAPFTY